MLLCNRWFDTTEEWWTLYGLLIPQFVDCHPLRMIVTHFWLACNTQGKGCEPVIQQGAGHDNLGSSMSSYIIRCCHSMA